MKNRIFKLMSAVAFTVAITAAFAFQKADNVALANETGWINTPVACAQSVQCQNVDGDACRLTVNGISYTAFGKYTSGDVTCLKPLYRIAP